MLKIKTLEIVGLEPAIHGMRNPKNSWAKSDSIIDSDAIIADGPSWPGDYGFRLGEKDKTLAYNLSHGGAVHAKYRRMIQVYADVRGPLYWWKESDTYRMGVERDSCSTMHTIMDKPFELADFSFDQMWRSSVDALEMIIERLNDLRHDYVLEPDPRGRKELWYNVIQLLPSSYMQKRTCMFSYEALAAMYGQRRNHKLYEWHTFCDWVEDLPYFKDIIEPSAR